MTDLGVPQLVGSPRPSRANLSPRLGYGHRGAARQVSAISSYSFITGSHTDMQIRCIVEQDYKQVRELRLAALQDSPDSFADSLRVTQDKPTQYWMELTKSLCNEHVMFILEQDRKLVGSGEASGKHYYKKLRVGLNLADSLRCAFGHLLKNQGP